ncbi:MAG TPA: hypothetical protein VKQ70_05585 [Caulobacteraceae bacterium]|jgi:hypothetical protein|nr:hypothetical protein [Caulobacteraceae bacterium]
MDARLRYSRDELMQSHAYARPHEEAGYKLHGGFLEDGSYCSPRTKARWPAVRAWQAALQARGWPIISADRELLQRGGYPNEAQQKLLLSEGFGRTMWNSLSITGIIEARGRALCNMPAPDMTKLVVEDVAETAIGHLGQGLLYAHGADEGGDPAAPGLGAHDAMWFAARDLVFGKGAYPVPVPPDSISRPDEGRLMPEIPEPFENLIRMLMNVLMIEVRAESAFAFNIQVFRDRDNFQDRRAEADLAATLVERIRTDEAIHVAYLATTISELRSFTLKRAGGGAIPGAEVIDPVWTKMVDWHGREERLLAAKRTRQTIENQLIEERGESARALLARFDALADPD